MPYTTYLGRNVAKTASGFLVAGSGDALSAATAALKADMLDDILQDYYQARGFDYDGTDISLTDVKKAIAYARGKKSSKAQRKTVISTTKATLHVVSTVGGFTIGSVIPGLGNVAGAVGGHIAGLSLGTMVTAADRVKRSGKGIYKWVKGTRGEHRTQAAKTLYENHFSRCNRADGRNPARDALIVILGDEYELVTKNGDLERIAKRLKSN